MDSHLLIKAQSAKWPRIKKALKKGENLILKDMGDHFIVTNVFLNKWKDGKTHAELFNWKGERTWPEVNLSRKSLTLAINGKIFRAEASTITLREETTV
jgi:hypothetical protein